MRERGDSAPPFVGLDPDMEGPPMVETPVDWWTLTKEERAEHLAELSTFVLNLTEYFVLQESVIPRCWYQHDALIQELLALMQYRQEHIFVEGAGAHAALDFYTQFVMHSMVRMQSWVEQMGCNGAEHFPDEDRYAAWMKPGTVTRAAWRTDFDNYLSALYGVGTVCEDNHNSVGKDTT